MGRRRAVNAGRSATDDGAVSAICSTGSASQSWHAEVHDRPELSPARPDRVDRHVTAGEGSRRLVRLLTLL
jgi:hypothetical protein